MSIDVVVPVHGAGPVFRRCAASLIAHADAFTLDASASAAAEHGSVEHSPVEASPMEANAVARHRLVIVLDGPPDAESVVAVEELRAAAVRDVGGFELSVLTHDTAVGFLRSANRAMRESSRDAVLLNSDTQVTAGWLGRLRAAAYSDSKIATVTPFSNNATICSLPRFLDENAIPAGYTIDSFGELVTRVSRREYPRLPTGVGFCLYVKRSVLDELGLFDEAFGLGYGEEVDLCFRAARRGYVHVLDDATFVFHEGGRSFGRRRERRMRRGERMMRERYPEYIPRISEFITTDSIAPARARVLDELRRALVSGDTGLAIEDAALAGGGVASAAEGAALARGGAEPSNGARLANAAETLEGAGPLPKKIEALSPGERVWVRGPLALGPRRVLHLAPGWPPFTSGDAATRDAAMAVRAMVRDQGARREVFVYARMTDPDRADGSAVEYVDGGVRVRLVLINGTPRTILSRLGVGGDAVGGDFARFVADVRADVVHVHDLAGESLDLLGVAHVRAIRGALKNVPAFVMGSQSIADRYAAARVLPPSARVHVAPPGMAEDIERVYEEVMKQPRS